MTVGLRRIEESARHLLVTIDPNLGRSKEEWIALAALSKALYDVDQVRNQRREKRRASKERSREDSRG